MTKKIFRAINTYIIVTFLSIVQIAVLNKTVFDTCHF